MRLLLIQNMVYAPSHGGANKANRRLLEELAARGHECRAVAPALGSHGAETLEDQRRELAQRGIEVAEAEAGLKLRTAGVTVTALVDRHRLAEVAAGCIEDFAPQLVLVTSEDPGQELLAAASRRAPGRVVYLVHTPLYLPFGPEGYVQSARGTELIRAAAAVITVSHWVRRYIERWSGVRARVLAFPVYPPPPVPRRGSFDSGAVTLVNPCAYKGLPIFLELARRFPETPFLGVETWGTTTEDRRLMARLPNLRLRGAADEIGEIFAETRVLLMPSLFLEAFGLLAVEAMLHGLPVLASASGGLPEAKLGVDYVLPVRTIENYSQRFDEREFPLAAVPPQNLEPWAAALEAVLTDRRRYQELSEQSRRAAAGFVQSVSIDPFEELFEQLISDLAAGTRSALPAEEAETERRSTEITGGEGATAEALKRKLLALRALKAQRRDTGDGGRGGIPRLPREGDPWPVAASFGQERLWFLQQLDPESVAYNLASLVELRGHLDLRLLAKSLNAVVGRHEVLRTVFEERDGQPGQVVFASARLDLPVIDLHRLGTAAEEVAEDLARSWTRRPFDLTRWPLLRLVVCRLRRRQHRLISVFHHIICDGWSAALFLRELVALYRGTEDRLAADPLQYADFAVWQRRQLETGQLEGAPQADRELEYWRGQLAGLETLAVPLKRPGGAPSGRGRRRFFELPQALAAALERVARTSGVSQFMVLLAGWLMVLHRATGQRDLVLGTPVAGRGRSELEAVMGLFVNSLVLRTVLAPDLGFEQVLERVRRTVIEAESHQRLPFERLVQALQPERELEGNPFFQVMFVVEQGVGEIADPGALELEELPLDPGTAMLDLLISLRPVEDGLRGWISFDDGLFGLAAIDRLVDLYRRLLQAAAASPRQPLAALPWVSAPERRQLLEEWAPGPRAAAPEASFTGLFEARAAATPAAVAVVWGQEEISYGQLLRRSAALGAGLAAGLAPRGVGAESLVALLAERGPDLLTAVVGLLRCGAAYLPLDPRHPARRNGEILASAGCAAILCAGELRPALDEALAGVPDPPPVLELEPLVRGGGAAAEPAQTVKAGLETLVYTIFTSGSTGRPKGAMVVRRGMVNHLLAKIRDLGLTAADTVAQTASQCFDISVWQMLAPLVVGGRVVIYPDAVAHDPAQLLRRAAVDGVTVLETVPSLMRLQLDGLPGSEAERPDLSRLRWLIPTGEALPRDLCRRWYRLYPQARLLNAYGPTECSDDVSHYAVPLEDRPEGASVSIGRPVLHTTLHVVDRRGRLLPPGLAGELWVGGRGVGRGYRNEPARTAAVFVPDSFSDSPGARVYRTGDLSRWLDDSNLEFLGRIDHQVKIRGFRIELGEIEHAVRSLPAIQDAVVAVTELGRESRLVAYAVLGTDAGDGRGPGPAELRQALAKQLPEHMVPTHWMMLSELPRLSSGKIDRKALPAAAPILREERYKPPRSFAEELLAGLWEEALGVRRLGVEDNVFDLGAHSLMVTQVRARTERALKVEIPLRRFFEAPTVEQLARLVEQAGAGMTAELEAPPLEPVPRDGDLPLSFSQRRLWFFDRLEPGSAVFNLPTAISLQGELSAAALSGAVTDVMRRHEVLRTRFLEVDGEPLQVLDPWERQTLPVVDLSALPVAERQRQGEALRQREALRPFDLQTGPLLRATLMRRGPSDHEALLTLHHIAADGWSMRLLTEEISAAYAARVTGTTPQLPPLPVQYADYAAWQRKWLDGPALEQELSFWKQYLDGAPDSIDLPLDRPRQPVQRYRGGRLSTWLPATLLGRLRSLSRELRSTLFMTLVTAWQGLLARSSHQTDLVLGTLIANRHRHEVQDLIGFFVNTLVLRTRLPRGRSFRAAVEEVRDTTLEIYAHQDLPFEKLVEELNPDRQLSLTPLFQILFIYQNAPTGEAQLPGLRLSARETARETVNYDLLFALSERDQGIHCQLDFDRDLFDSTTVQRLLGHFRTLVESLVTAPDRPMEKAELWSAAERHQALVEWNDTRREDPLERGGWAQLFADTARRRGDAPAVVCGGESWSYRRLAAQVEDAAKLLAAAGVGEDSVVAVLAPRGLELLVGILAVFRCGGAYLPLDPAHPQRRLGQILESSGVGWCLVTEELVPLARDAVEQLGSESLPRLMELGELLAERSPAGSGPRAVAPLPPMSSLASSEALAYCLFTSGSTGVPKGVMVHQAGFLNHLWMMVEIFGLGPEDVVAQNASQCFDISVWQLTAALLVGGVVHIVDDAVAGDPTELLAEVEARAITVLELVPSLLAAVMDEIEAREQDPRRTPPALHRLRWIIPTGEALPPALARRWLRRYPGIPMVNAYGPAECSDDVSVEFLRRPGDAERAVVAVGRPLRNLALHLLDPQGRPVPVGVVGEIHVGGIGVGRGYLRDPRRTAEVFVPHALGGPAGGRLYASGDLGRFQPDGRIDFLGRRDHQVKVRGFRIEVGEVEAALDEHPQVERALVMVHRGRERAVAQLVAYAEVPAAVLPAAEEGVAAAPDGFDLRAWADELRDFLGERLPKYMVPSLFVPLAAFPLNANGKIDVAALPAPEEGAGARVLTAPRSRTERAVAEIWQQVLGIREVGVEDDFFDLGGHSLLATRVLSRLRAALGVDLALRDLFEATDLGSLAKKLDQQLGEASPFAVEPIEPLPPTAPAELSFAQERLWFLAQLDPTSAAYNLPAAIRLTGAVDHRLWHRVFQEILQRHQALRTTFRQVEGKPRQVVHQGLGLSLPVVDLEGLDTPVADREIHRLAVADAQCPFDLMVPPLLRCALLRQDRERHVLLLNMHHIVSDAWSMALLLQELAVLSEAFAAGEASPLPALPVQYPDFAHWQRRLLRGQHLECQLEFWRGQLQGAPPALDLPRRSSGTGDGFGDRGATRRFHLPAELSEELRVLSRRTGSTLFMTLLAAFATLLHRYSGASDLNVGVPVAGRPRAEMEGLIGFFVNTLVLRLGIGREATVRELLADVRGRSLDAFAHEDLPFERLVAELNPERDLTRSPLFQVMFALQTAPVAQVEVPGLVLERLDIDSGTTRFELFLELTEAGDVIEGAAHFSLELFDPAFMMRFLGHFRTLLEGFASAPEGAVGNLPLLAQSERHQVLREWNDSAAAVPLDRPFPQLFRSAAERWPQRRAAAVGDRSLTYAELFQRSSVLARRLEGRGVGPGTVLPLLAERSLELLTAVLAVLHTGAVYLPLDPRHPAPRLAQVLEESGCTTVVCAAELLPLLQEAGEILDPAPRAVKLEELLDTAEAAETPRGGAAPAGGAEHLAYVIYTSGSTGRPKGAMVTQRGMVNHLHAKIRDLGLTGDDVVAQTASQCFDISVWQMLAALMVGGRVEIYPDEVAHDPAVLVQRVDADDVTILETVPSLMRLLLDELGRRAERPELRALRWLVPTGEALPPELCSRWYEAYPAIRLLNAYGPTECSDDVSHYPVPAGEGAVVKTISIGRPVLNTQLYVVDRLFRPVPPGVVGELWVGGQGVGGGYLHDPQRTAEVFVPDAFSGAAAGRLYRTGDLVRHLPDGRLSFLGRVDHQVKIRGHRLELGEVEAQLQRHPALEAAVVAAQKETSGALQLVAYVLYGDVGEVPVEELRGFLQERLPTYAVPTAWTVLEELPLTPNGKVNRRALPRVSAEGQAGDRPYTAPRDETEEALAEIFAGLIGIQRVGVFDDFFDLGGHSLLATQALSRIRETFAIDLELRRLFEAPTVAELAGVVEDRIIEQIESLSDEEVDSLLEEDEPAPLAPAPTEDLVESLPERSG